MTGLDAPTGAFRASLGISRPLPTLLVLIALLALTVAGLWTSIHGHGPANSHGHSDTVLYERVIGRVHRGEPYYPVAAEEQRAGGYPMRPFIVVRPPLLAVAMAALPNEGVRQLALWGLVLVTFCAWGWRLVEMGAGRLSLTLELLLLGSGASLAVGPTAYAFHEIWAGLLMALSMAVRRPDRWMASVLIGLLAALTRELAAAYLLAMAVLAWRDGCRKETVGWIAALAAVAGVLAVHAAAVNAQLVPGDSASQGWVRIGGWPFVLSAIHWNALLIIAPQWAAALVAPLALLGLAAWRGPFGERVALTVFGYVAAFVFVGRPENNYWGFLIAPLWPLGLLLAPRMLLALGRNLRPRDVRVTALTRP
jgi:hypothetical protein